MNFRTIAVSLVLLTSNPVWAQNLIVFYDHGPGLSDAQRHARYIPPGGSESSAEVGRVPRRIEVRKGSEACFEIIHSNRLLYEYNIGSRTFEVSTPDDYATFLATAQKILSSFAAINKGSRSGIYNGAVNGVDLNEGERSDIERSASLVAAYFDRLDGLSQNLGGLEKEIHASDSQLDLRLQATNMLEEVNDALAATAGVGAMYTKLEAEGIAPTLSGASPSGLQTAQSFQALAEARLKAIKSNLEKVLADLVVPPRHCQEIGDSPMRLVLTAKRTSAPPAGTKPLRPVDTLAVFEVVPRSTERFRFAPGALVSYPLSAGGVSFTVRDSMVVQEGASVVQSVMPAAQFRVRETPLWGTVGVGARSLTTVPDLYLGLAYDFGDSIGGASATLGIGVTVLQTPVRLSKGNVGERLPADVKELNDIVERKPLLGVGFTFTVGSLNLGGKK